MGVPKKDRFNDNWYGIRKREWYGVILRLTQDGIPASSKQNGCGSVENGTPASVALVSVVLHGSK